MDEPDHVVDTNVAIVANGRGDWPPECELDCVVALTDILSNGGLVLDDLGQIVEEYSRHLSYSGQPGLGDAFFRWVHNNQYREDLCTMVPITPDDDRGFVEFPSDDRLTTFDRSDRKFVATALAHGNADVLTATDSDWWTHREVLAGVGVMIWFGCEGYFRAREASGRR